MLKGKEHEDHYMHPKCLIDARDAQIRMEQSYRCTKAHPLNLCDFDEK